MKDRYLYWIYLLSGSMLAACGHHSYYPIFKPSPSAFIAPRPDSSTARLILADSATKPPARITSKPTHRGAPPQRGHTRGQRVAGASEANVSTHADTASRLPRALPRLYHRGAAAANDPFVVLAIAFTLLIVTGLVFLIRFIVRAATRLVRQRKAKS